VKDIIRNIEAIIYASEDGITPQDIKHVLQEALAIEISKDELQNLIDKIIIKHQSEDEVLELKVINNSNHWTWLHH